MKSKTAQNVKVKPKMSYEDRKRRSQQVLFAALAMVIIISWLITTVVTLR
jgi:hypothetical protein